MKTGRSKFAAKFGAMCTNPQFAWSYINEVEKFVLFGAWEHEQSLDKCRIFSEGWKTNASGRKNNGYGQSLMHIRKIVDEGFNLMTFSMIAVDPRPSGATKVKSFSEDIVPKKLVKVGVDFFAVDPSTYVHFEKAELESQDYWEGAKREVLQSAYERNPDARKKCLEAFGYTCSVCKLDFRKYYGDFAGTYIHVHHIIPVATKGGRHKVDPLNDLSPVCPNCHAMLHRKNPPYGIDEMKHLIQRQTSNH
jgi:5-methylcytosine-specific restriction enzyme A